MKKWLKENWPLLLVLAFALGAAVLANRPVTWWVFAGTAVMDVIILTVAPIGHWWAWRKARRVSHKASQRINGERKRL